MAEESVADDESRAEKRAKRPRTRRRHLIEWAVVLVAAALTAMVLRAEVVQAFEIPSLSMAPTLRVGDRVLVNKLGYRMHDVHRGDIVVFERPPVPVPANLPEAQIKDLIKRVIALPGETVSTNAAGRILINGKPLAEPYLPPGVKSDIEGERHVPPGHFWVMGDNRTQSRDSRFFGPIKESSIIGRAFVRMWPVNHWGGL